MKAFMLLFRMDILNASAQPTSEQMESYMRDWKRWTDHIEQQNKLLGGNHFSREGKLLSKGNHIIDRPYVADNNSVAGYLIIQSENMDEATAIALKCPILQGDHTSVEIREIEMTE